MAKPRIPHDEGSASHSGQSAGGRDGGAHSIAAAQAEVASVARLGRPGGGSASRGAAARAAGPVQGPAATIPLKPPNNRHNLDSIRPKNPAKEKNTIVLPGTDVAADLADISAGRGTWNAETNRYEVNSRTYVVESTGTVFPVSGPGLVNLSRSEYKVLKQLIGADGNINTARDALRRDPSVSDADWRSALEVFKHHKSYKGGA
jgi:hypothetical protein